MDQRAIHATRQLRAWLQATKVPFYFHDGQIAIKTPTGGKIAVEVDGGDGLVFDEGVIKVPSAFIVKPHRGETFVAFHAITRLAGYGAPIPIDRGPEPGPNLRNRYDGLDTLFRHRELRRAPNPSPEKFDQYKKVIDIATNRFLRMNTPLCEQMKWEFSDVRQLALLWTVNFCGHWENPAPEPEENERNLMTYLKQRFYELHVALLEKKKSNVPDIAVVASALLDNQLPVQIYAASKDSHEKASSTDLVDPTSSTDSTLICPSCESSNIAVQRPDFYCLSCGETFVHAQIGRPQGKKAEQVEVSSLRANKKLLSLLGALPHDEMIRRLEEAANNEYIAEDARKLARRRLNIHLKSCNLCACCDGGLPKLTIQTALLTNKLVVNKPVEVKNPSIQPIRWSKTLSSSDAQRKKKGKQRSGITLTTENLVFFKNDFFGGETWESATNKGGSVVETAKIPFHVTVLGKDQGAITLKVSFSSSRIKNMGLSADQARGGRPATILHTKEILPFFLVEDMTGKTLVLEKASGYSLKIV